MSRKLPEKANSQNFNLSDRKGSDQTGGSTGRRDCLAHSERHGGTLSDNQANISLHIQNIHNEGN